jgi:hypothetical protein
MKLQYRCAFVLACFPFGCGGAPAAGQSGRTSMTAAAAASPSLDGRSYEVTLEIPDASPVKDTLRFMNGKFESTACTSLGFPQWSDYAARVDGREVAFHVLAKHPSGTTIDWNRSILGDEVDGKADRTTNGKTDVLRFKGSLRP